jgi:hypothetical protein
VREAALSEGELNWRRLIALDAGWNFIQEDDNLLWVLIAGVSGFALGCLVYWVAATSVQLHWRGPSIDSAAGIVGWATVNHYPKQRDLLYYLTAVGFVPAFSVAWL